MMAKAARCTQVIETLASPAPEAAQKSTGPWPEEEAVDRDRLLELARRYHELRLVSMPFEKWQVKAFKSFQVLRHDRGGRGEAAQEDQ